MYLSLFKTSGRDTKNKIKKGTFYEFLSSYGRFPIPNDTHGPVHLTDQLCAYSVAVLLPLHSWGR
jgi:hypothetical protein